MRRFESFFTNKQFENYRGSWTDDLAKVCGRTSFLFGMMPKSLIAEKGIDHVIHKEVPITGRIDLLLKGQDGRVRVVDFKTGNLDNGHQSTKN